MYVARQVGKNVHTKVMGEMYACIYIYIYIYIGVNIWQMNVKLARWRLKHVCACIYVYAYMCICGMYICVPNYLQITISAHGMPSCSFEKSHKRAHTNSADHEKSTYTYI